jgi:hypothetical protein
MLADAELDEVQARIRRGETLRPSEARLRAAEALLTGKGEALEPLRGGALLALVIAGLTFTPILPLAAFLAWRDTARARQALLAAALSGALLAVAWTALVWMPLPAG